ncbi:dUTP diphosphatase [Halobacillus salinus]|uniref:dUTPase n=1 Tax=Halobacillus salinus TaxID=192814 RepID=A0A4Z0H115_9BACI|nr:dUTP diphosphatase [Halobacillus salinus]TGB04103.1 dUTPase [Halobacillus salinus]
MNWGTLYEMQQQLDHYIEETHNLPKAANVKEKTLALLVELGELANETRCFKFWSLKGPSDGETILEEYVDGLHFLLSIGLDLEMRYQPQPLESYEQLTTGFLATYAAIDAFQKSQDLTSYQTMFTSFLRLGQTLGFEEKGIMNAYYAKNEVNYQRQEEGY